MIMRPPYWAKVSHHVHINNFTETLAEAEQRWKEKFFSCASRNEKTTDEIFAERCLGQQLFELDSVNVTFKSSKDIISQLYFLLLPFSVPQMLLICQKQYNNCTFLALLFKLLCTLLY